MSEHYSSIFRLQASLAKLTCSDGSDNCVAFQQLCSSIRTDNKESKKEDLISVLDEVIVGSWNTSVNLRNLKKMCSRCDVFFRAAICWMIAVRASDQTIIGEMLIQYGEIISISFQFILKFNDSHLVSEFELASRRLYGNLSQFKNQLLAPLKLKVAIQLSLCNAYLVRVEDCDLFISEVGTLLANFPENFEMVSDMLCYGVGLLGKCLGKTEIALTFAEKYKNLAKTLNIPLGFREAQLMKFIAIAKSKSGDFKSALDLVASAEKIAPSLDLQLLHFRIFVASNPKNVSDVVTKMIDEIITHPSVSIEKALGITYKLYSAKYDSIGDVFLASLWRIYTRDKTVIGPEILPLFAYRLRRLLVTNSNSDAAEMFKMLDRAPHILKEFQPEFSARICNLLNSHAVKLVKAGHYQEALTFYGFCDALFERAPCFALASTNMEKKECPSRGQIKRSLALCYFHVGRFEECDKSIAEAQALEPSAWIHFLRFYILVNNISNERSKEAAYQTGQQYLQEILQSSHSDVYGLLDLAASVATKANVSSLAAEALLLQMKKFFESENNCLFSDIILVTGTLKKLIGLEMSEWFNNQEPKNFSAKSSLIASYFTKANSVIKTAILSNKHDGNLCERVKWFSEVSWHIANRTNGFIIHCNDENPNVDLREAKAAVMQLYCCSADFMLEVGDFYCNDKKLRIKALGRHCLALSLSLGVGVDYYRSFPINDSQLEMADHLLSISKKCYEGVTEIAAELGCEREVAALSFGDSSVLHTLPIFEFEIHLRCWHIESARIVLIKLADATLKKCRVTSFDETQKDCAAFERCVDICYDIAIRRGNARMECSAVLELSIKCIGFLSTCYCRLPGNDKELEDHTNYLASALRKIFQACTQYDRENFHARTSALCSLLEQIPNTDRFGEFWTRARFSEAEWLVSCCWNTSLSRHISGFTEDAKSWHRISMALARSRPERCLADMVSDKFLSLKRWEGAELKV